MHRVLVAVVGLAAAHQAAAWAPASSTAAYDLSGQWFLQAAYEEDYTITASSGSVFDVVCGPGRCTAWKTANITVQPVVNGTVDVFIVFDNGVQHGGEVVLAGYEMVWADASVWTRVRPSRCVITRVWRWPRLWTGCYASTLRRMV